MADDASQSSKGQHGGKRVGAGRKRKTEKYAGPINKAEGLAAKRLVRNIENLAKLADGGYERIVECFEPAGLVLRDMPILDSEGQPLRDANGKVIIAKQLAYPHLDPDEPVLVERRREIAEPDRAANIWLTEFIAGKPAQQQDTDPYQQFVEQLLKDLDLTKLTKEQVDRLAAGDDPIRVLLNLDS